MEEIKTHRKIDRSLSGEPLEIGKGRAKVRLKTDEKMAADEKGLVHGGFLFSAADYTAMLAVNHPNVVLAGAEVKFLKPVVIGEEIIFEGEVKDVNGKKHRVYVAGSRDGEKVFEGNFLCVVPERHVLERL